MGCCTSAPETKKVDTPAVNHQEQVPPEYGLYLTLYEDELFIIWAEKPPDDEEVVAFGHPQNKVPAAFLTQASKLVSSGTEEEDLMRGISAFVKEAATKKCSIFLRKIDSMSIPIMLVAHQPGNGIIGDRLSRISPGDEKSLSTEGTDMIAVVPDSTDAFNTRTLPAKEFMDAVDEVAGFLARLDPSGRTPPLIVEPK